MTEMKVDDQNRIEEEPNPTPELPSGSRMTLLIKVFLLILVPVIAAGAAFRAGLFETPITWLKSHGASEKPATVLTGLPVRDLLSSRNELAQGEKKPVDSSQVLLSPLDKSGASDSPDSVKACPPDILREPAKEGEVANRTTIAAGSVGLPERESESSNKDTDDTPTIVTRKPPEKDLAEKETDKKDSKDDDSRTSPASVAQEAHRAQVKEGAGPFDELRNEDAQAAGKEKEQHATDQMRIPPPIPRKPGKTARIVERAKSNKDEVPVVPNPESGSSDAAKAERFQLPGALQVKIASYEGSLTKWGMMVILDDSASMAKKVKPWAPDRSKAAVTLVGKLPEIVTPGSKMAVRDFLCRKSTANKKVAPCLSHVLYEWSGAPFKDLKPNLDRVDPQGSNNPCAAAEFVVKRELSGLGQTSPRVLVVTNGAVKCLGARVTKAIDQHKGTPKIAVDVIGIGISQKTTGGYAQLAKKTGGAFLKVNSPDDVERTIARYKKILHKRTMERIEVRGENAVFTVNPGEEITLAPGTYSVVLPLVGNLMASKRTIAKVTIKSGETKVLQVRINKGKPMVKFANAKK